MFRSKRRSSKLEHGYIDFRDMLLSEILEAVQGVRDLCLNTKGKEDVGPSDSKSFRLVCDSDREADYLCQCIEKCLLFGLKTRTVNSHIWPMITSLSRKTKPKNPSLGEFYGRAVNTKVQWDRTRILIRTLLNERSITCLFEWIGTEETFVHRWYQSYGLMRSEKDVKKITGYLAQLADIPFKLGPNVRPRYSWNITDGFPGMVYNVLGPAGGDSDAPNPIQTSSSMSELPPQHPKTRALKTAKSTTSLAEMIRKRMAFSPSFSKTNGSMNQGVSGSGASSVFSPCVPTLDSDKETFEAVRNSGRMILLRDAARAVEKEMTYRDWLRDFSPRDACDPERGSRISSRAGITSAFAQAWIGAGGAFSNEERLSMELTPDEKRQQAMYLLTRAQREVPAPVKERANDGANNGPGLGKMADGVNGSKGQNSTSIRTSSRIVTRVVCHGRVYRMSLKNHRQPFEYLMDRLNQLLGGKTASQFQIVAIPDTTKQKAQTGKLRHKTSGVHEFTAHPLTHPLSCTINNSAELRVALAKNYKPGDPYTACKLVLVKNRRAGFREEGKGSSMPASQGGGEISSKDPRHRARFDQIAEIRENYYCTPKGSDASVASLHSSKKSYSYESIESLTKPPPSPQAAPPPPPVVQDANIKSFQRNEEEGQNEERPVPVAISININRTRETQAPPNLNLPVAKPVKNLSKSPTDRENNNVEAKIPSHTRRNIDPEENDDLQVTPIGSLSSQVSGPFGVSPQLYSSLQDSLISREVDKFTKTQKQRNGSLVRSGQNQNQNRDLEESTISPRMLSTSVPKEENHYLNSNISLLDSSFVDKTADPPSDEVEVKAVGRFTSDTGTHCFKLSISDPNPFKTLEVQLSEVFRPRIPPFQIACQLAYGEISITSSGVLRRVLNRASRGRHVLQSGGEAKSITLCVSNEESYHAGTVSAEIVDEAMIGDKDEDFEDSKQSLEVESRQPEMPTEIDEETGRQREETKKATSLQVLSDSHDM